MHSSIVSWFTEYSHRETLTGVCRHPMFGRHMTLLALKKPGAQNYFSLVRPNTGESYFDMEVCYIMLLCFQMARWPIEEDLQLQHIWPRAYDDSL